MRHSKDRRRIRFAAIRRIFSHLSPHLKPYRRTLAIAGLCMLGTTLMELLRPWPLKFIFDVILATPEQAAPLLNRLPEVTPAC